MKTKILGATYEVQMKDAVVTSAQECYGTSDYGQQVLEISNNGIHPQKQAAVVVHEAIHAALHESGHPEHCEQHVIALGNAIPAIIRDNPWLVDLIRGETTLTELLDKEKTDGK